MSVLKQIASSLICLILLMWGVGQVVQLDSVIVEVAYAQKTENTSGHAQGLTGRQLYDEAIAVSKLLRDPSSANNTLYESETALSGELKALIYQKLREGATRGEILDFMAERYGEAVRYQPDFNASTFLLWASPWIAVVLGALFFWRTLRRREKPRKIS